MGILRTFHWKVLWGTQNGSFIASHWKLFFGTFICKSVMSTDISISSCDINLNRSIWVFEWEIQLNQNPRLYLCYFTSINLKQAKKRETEYPFCEWLVHWTVCGDTWWHIKERRKEENMASWCSSSRQQGSNWWAYAMMMQRKDAEIPNPKNLTGTMCFPSRT